MCSVTSFVLILSITLAEGQFVTNVQFNEQFKVMTESIVKLTSAFNDIHRENSVLRQQMRVLEENCILKDLLQSVTIEERVTYLEVQMTEVHNDITSINEDVDFLFDEQVLQDVRLLELEDETENLQITSVQLDARVTVLEETTSNHDTRLTTTESNVEDLQSADLSFDERITALEGNSGGSGNATIAFYATLVTYSSISNEQSVPFDIVVVNEQNGYNSDTGVFTVPYGGGGLYYFSTFLMIPVGESSDLQMRKNNEPICTARGDHQQNSGDVATATCSAVVNLVAGDEVNVVLEDGDTTPLHAYRYRYNGFSGFRI